MIIRVLSLEDLAAKVSKIGAARADEKYTYTRNTKGSGALIGTFKVDGISLRCTSQAVFFLLLAPMTHAQACRQADFDLVLTCPRPTTVVGKPPQVLTRFFIFCTSASIERVCFALSVGSGTLESCTRRCL